MSSPRRLVAAALFAAGVAALGGCASDHRKGDIEKSRRFQRDVLETRATAAGVGVALAAEADLLGKARHAGNDAAVARALDGLKFGHTLLEGLEEVELTFALASRFFEVHDDIEVPPSMLSRLEADVGKLIDTAATERARIQAYLKAPVPLSDPSLEPLKREVERDRAALKAYRMDVGLSTRIGGT